MATAGLLSLLILAACTRGDAPDTPGPGGEPRAPATPSGVRAEAGDGQVALSWNANGETNLAGYRVYRAAAAPVETTSANRLADVAAPATDYVDRMVSNGTTYHYTVTAVSVANLASPAAQSVMATPRAEDGHTPPVNQAPVVDAGPDQSVTLPADTVTLAGQVSDDGLPDGALTTSWSQLSGPGTVTFADAASPTTTARFSVAGTYELRLTASDGELGSHDDMSVSVLPQVDEAPAGFTAVNWSSAARAPGRRSEAQGAAVGGKLYVFGGYSSFDPLTVLSNVDVYDPVTNTWTQLPPMPTPLTHMGTAVDGPDIYIASGYVGIPGGGQTFATTEVWKFNVNSREWTAMPGLPEARGSGGLALLGRDLHFFGGSDARRRDKSEHWVLNLDNLPAGWRTTTHPLLPARNHMSALTLNGKIYAIGGQQGQDEASTTLNLVSVWDPKTASWSEAAPLRRSLSHISAAAFIMDGRIIVAGGEIKHNDPVADVWAYDPVQNDWTALTSLELPRRSGVAEAINGQIIFTTGGAPGFSDRTWRGVPQR